VAAHLGQWFGSAGFGGVNIDICLLETKNKPRMQMRGSFFVEAGEILDFRPLLFATPW